MRPLHYSNVSSLRSGDELGLLFVLFNVSGLYLVLFNQ